MQGAFELALEQLVPHVSAVLNIRPNILLFLVYKVIQV